MSWELNRLLKTTGITYIPGSPAIPGSAGSAGTPAYTYWEETVVSGATYSSPLPPSGWDTIVTTPLPGGGTQTIRSGGYRYFDGVKAYLSAIFAGVEYIYVAESQTVLVEVSVPAVPSVPPTPPVPATEAEIIEDYNLGWNSGALGPAPLAVNTVFRWRMSAGNVGSVVGLTLTTAPQDNGYTGMSLSVMAQSGIYQLYRGGIPFGATAQFTDYTRFALSRTNTGDVEVYVDGGLVHTEELAADVIVDCSLFSGGDLIWDAEELAVALAPLNTNLGAVTVSDAQAVASAIAVTRVVGPGTAIGVAGATTVSRAINGQVKVDGSVYVDIGETSEEGGTGGGRTLTAAVGVAGAITPTQTFGPGTAKGVAGATTTSDAVATGDTATGVGISTSGGSGDPAMLPLAGAASGPGVAVGWTGNYVGDAMRMRPLTVSAAGGLVEPTIGIGTLTLAPMDGDAGGVTGGISVSSSCSMLPLRALASSETEYSEGYLSFPPLIGIGTNIPYEANIAIQKIVDYADDNTNPTPTVQDYADAGVVGVIPENLDAVNEAIDALTGEDVGTTEDIQAVVDGVLAAIEAIEKIADYADDNTNPIPAVEDYEVAGVIGVTPENLDDVNAAIDAVTGAEADTLEEIQAIVDAVLAGVTLKFVSETVSTSSTMQYNLGVHVLERLSVLAAAQTFWNPQAEILENLTIAAAQQIAVALNIPEAVSVEDAQTFALALNIAERMVLDGQVETFYEAVALLAEAVSITDATREAWSLSAAEALSAADATTELFKQLALLAEALSATDAMENVLAIVVSESVSMEIADGVDILGHYLANVSEQPGIWVGFKLGDEAFTGWVVNTEGNKPISEYTDYPFNSFCELGGVYYGAAEDGLYRLDGGDDAGEPISASIMTMMTDFNSTKMKRVPTAYVGYTADGKMVLRVRAVSGGELREHWFTATHRTADAPREQVIKLGRGIRSRYWQFELANVDGADFEIDKLELYPVFLNRRV